MAPRRILVSISTSSPTLSKSSNIPFDIILDARVEGSEQVTIDSTHTILSPRSLALDYQGLTFTDSQTGGLVPRVVIDVHSVPSESISAENGKIIEIPPTKSAHSKVYSVSHTLSRTSLNDGLTSEALQALEQIIKDHPELVQEARHQNNFADSQIEGFEVGKRYEIGLPQHAMAVVGCWRPGSKEDAFGSRKVWRREKWAGSRETIEMVLVNRARFEVVA